MTSLLSRYKISPNLSSLLHALRSPSLVPFACLLAFYHPTYFRMGKSKDKKAAKRSADQEKMVAKLAQNFGRSVRLHTQILIKEQFL